MVLKIALERKTKFKSQQGFSLIEVLVALSLFSFSMLGMASLQININRMILDSFEKSKALNLAISRHEISELTRSNPESTNELLALWEQQFAARIPYMSTHVDETKFKRVSIFWASSQQNPSNCEREESSLSKENPENCLRL